jgi:hypothetical protein
VLTHQVIFSYDSCVAFPPVLPPFPIVIVIMLSCPYLLLLLAFSKDEGDEVRTLALQPQPLRRHPVVLVFDVLFDVVLVTVALSVVFVSLIILPAAILILPLFITIFSLVFGFAAISFVLSFVTAIVAVLLSPLFTVAVALFSCSLPADPRIKEVDTRQTEGQLARMRAGGRQDHRDAPEQGEKPIWLRLMCF